MTTGKAKLISWDEVNKQQLSNPVEALTYLKFTAKNEPDMMPYALSDVLDACPRLSALAIPLYAHLLTLSDLTGLTERIPEAASYIEKHQPELLLLLSA